MRRIGRRRKWRSRKKEYEINFRKKWGTKKKGSIGGRRRKGR